MTDQLPAVSIAHPPEGLLRAVNPAVKFLLGTPLGGSLRRQMMVLNFTGRKSGRQYSVPVGAHRLDTALYALASAGWTANFRDGADADLSHRAAESYGAKTAQRMMGLKFRDNRVPTLEEFTEAAQRDGMRAVKFTAA